MLIKYLIFTLTPLAIVYLSIQLWKYKNNKILMVIISLCFLIILIASILILKQVYTPVPHVSHITVY
jgi:LPS O-antigen subunit length determinant protein (WzzB/FepE family)